ncbi:uroporphyrinogen-III C-methyltransferase [Volucribacter psittacicida]|uniref:Siroheme synthase n=1 Tax=Volucribacter psittacicida TaxID=203482 RepID=A0A4R1FMM5_9PAST|nr:siroheme synthase CysG [Volucribacter psittacicida]TCJ95823.1 uroporphyrinogen-III C-methyltransferase [Volucribacter psittacicida]
MNYFPIFADLNHRPVLVIGGGSVATRKVSLLLKANAEIRLVAPKLSAKLSELVEQGKVIWLAKTFNAEQVRSVFLIICATNDSEFNQRVYHIAQQQHKLINTVDDQPHCNFIFPSIIDRNPIQIAISSGGTAPVLARLLREKLEALLPQHLGTMATIAGRWRDKIKQKIKGLTARRRFWEQLFNGKFAQLVTNQQLAQAEQELAQQLEQDDQGGFVSLVGAGPGDAGLLTLKGLQEIQQADVVLYDALVSKDVLELVRRDADLVFVGKRGKGEQTSQQKINQLLVQYAQQGKRVVRLKGGDPFVFGRGGEELETLKAENIPFAVVPGITAGIGATAYAGIPLTHRDYAQSAIFVTGHRKDQAEQLEWQSLARSQQTLVIYMGTIKAKDIADKLIQFGRAATTPVAIISQGTQLSQQTLIGELQQLAELSEQVPTPALIVIGEVVQLHHQLAWFGEQKQAQKAPHFTIDNLRISQVA